MGVTDRKWMQIGEGWGPGTDGVGVGFWGGGG